MSKREKIHLAYKLPNGVQVMMSEKISKFLKDNKIEASKIWRMEQDIGLCVIPVKCNWGCIQIMANTSVGTVDVAADLSHAYDNWCICPEGKCIGVIRHMDLGIALKDPPVYISFEEMVKKIPVDQRKPFMNMLQEMKADT